MNSNCIICNQPISQERLEALQFLGKQPQDYICLDCAKQNDNKIKMIYTGFSGISPTIICNKVNNDKPEWEEFNNYVEPVMEDNEELG